MTAPLPQRTIVHVLAPAPFGGLESVVQALAAGQAVSGDRVCVAPVLTEHGNGHPFVESMRQRGVEVVPLFVGVRRYLSERRAVRELLRRRGADVLHTHGYRPDVVDAPAAREMGIPTVTTVHGYTGNGLKNRTYEWMQTRAFRRFDAVIAVSSKLRGELVRGGLPAERVHAVRNAWEPSTDVLSREEARTALGLPTTGPVVAWIGRMSPEKAPDVMVRALTACATPELVLSMIGTGPLEPRVRALASSSGVGGRVRWHGVVRNAARYLAAYDGVVITSWTEGTPMTLLEAVAAGVPVVSTRVGGIPDVVSSEEAWLVPAGDTAGIAEAVDEVVSDRATALQRAASARRRLARELGVGPWVEQHRRIYASILEGK